MIDLTSMLQNETVLWTAVGIVASSFVTWHFSRKYYLKASRERPDWIAGVIDDLEGRFIAANPNADPGDLVAEFERALGEHGFSIDKLPEAP